MYTRKALVATARRAPRKRVAAEKARDRPNTREGHAPRHFPVAHREPPREWI